MTTTMNNSGQTSRTFADKLNPNTYRVLLEEAYSWPPRKPPAKDVKLISHEKSPQRNKPRKLRYSGFLFENAATLNTPISFIRTYDSSGELVNEQDWYSYSWCKEQNSTHSKHEKIKMAPSVLSTAQDSYRRWEIKTSAKASEQRRPDLMPQILPLHFGSSEGNQLSMCKEEITSEHVQNTGSSTN
ncbi:unnamed protein product [Calicophoron daubneyi]|uniref:Uncharacterized protein n=1 Tax=Calicophoron daubneyi TaxID=300641 RepID=A0AAV2T338_CALDB